MSETTETPILWIEPHQHPSLSGVSQLLDYSHGSREWSDLSLVHASGQRSAKFFKFNCGPLFIRDTSRLSEHLKRSWPAQTEILVEPCQAFALLAYKKEPNIVVPPKALDVDVDEAGVLHHEADRVQRLQLQPCQREGIDALGVLSSLGKKTPYGDVGEPHRLEHPAHVNRLKLRVSASRTLQTASNAGDASLN